MYLKNVVCGFFCNLNQLETMFIIFAHNILKPMAIGDQLTTDEFQYSLKFRVLIYVSMVHLTPAHLPPAHHSHPPSHIHCFIPGSKLTFSTNLFHHSLLAPT